MAAGCRYTPDANGHVVVPAGVTSIGNFAFQYCDPPCLSIALPESLTSIGYCTRLSTAPPPWRRPPFDSFTEGLTSIGTQAFRRTLLTEADVTLPASLGEEKRHWYWYNCMGYTELVLPEGISTI